MNQSAQDRFNEIVSGPDERINLAVAALIIAENEQPGLDADAYLHRFDVMADQVRGRIIDAAGVEQIVAELNRYLFEDLKFRGNIEEFNDPRNSYLDQVLDRRLGIPITLSLIFMEIGTRLGLVVRGISFPGHFLVKVEADDRDLILDPFSRGIPLDEPELQRRLAHFSDEHRRHWRLDDLLQPATNREILARMLRNLKNVHFNSEDYRRALDCVNFSLSISPGAPVEIRDRAYIYEQLQYIHAAINDYQEYLMLSPHTEETQTIRHRLADLKRSVQRLH